MVLSRFEAIAITSDADVVPKGCGTGGLFDPFRRGRNWSIRSLKRLELQGLPPQHIIVLGPYTASTGLSK
jgi:hypothetical protein